MTRVQRGEWIKWALPWIGPALLSTGVSLGGAAIGMYLSINTLKGDFKLVHEEIGALTKAVEVYNAVQDQRLTDEKANRERELDQMRQDIADLRSRRR